MGIPSPDFIARFGTTEKDFEGMLKLWREYPKLMKAFIGHCRKSSVGNSFDNKNNHPIQIGDLMLIHNGTLTNHEKIFDKLKVKRIGDVDSEAIGHLLNHYTKNGSEPFTSEIIKETTRRMHGSYSVLAMSGNNPYQVAQFRDGRPAEMVLVKPLKMVYIASEKKFLETVLFEYNKMAKLFMTSAKFPHITKADVEFQMLPDDSMALWDLTTPIEKDTTIKDLYQWEKVPLRIDKVWHTTTTYQGNKNTSYNQKKVGTSVDAKNKSTGTTSVGDDKDADGLVWSKSLNKFKTQSGITDSKDIGAITIDVEKGEINKLDDESTGDDAIKEVDKNQIENLLVSAAETKELSIKKVSNVVKKSSNKKNDDTDNVPKVSGDTVEVEMAADAQAIKKAEEHVENGLSKYENDEEVVNDLDVSDVSILLPLPMYALANRIKKFIFKRGFIEGYTARKKEIREPASGTGDEKTKTENAEKKIRLMKMVVKIMGNSLALRCKGNTPTAVADMIKVAIDEVYGIKDVQYDLSAAFTVGDLNQIPMLKEIQEKMSK
jgi:hypothetical protein